MPLRRLGNGRLGLESAGGSGNVTVIVNNNAGNTRATSKEQTDGRGGRKVIVQIDEMVAAALTRLGSASRRALLSTVAVGRR
jgi:hypothetical protein